MYGGKPVESQRHCRSDAIRLQLQFAVLVAGTIGAAMVLRALYWSVFKAPVVDPSLVIARLRVGLRPEPAERFIFLVLASAVPFLAYSLVLKTCRGQFIQKSRLAQWADVKYFAAAMPLVLSLTFLWPFVGFNFGSYLFSGRSLPGEHPRSLMAACLMVASVWYGWVSMRLPSMVKQRRWIGALAAILFTAALFLQIGSWRLLTEASITVSPSWGSADAVIYTISQVAVGKTLLVDMPSQYGFFAEYLGPVFRVIGLSIFTFTALWAALQIVSLGSVFYVLQQRLREPALKVMVGLALIMVTFEMPLWLILGMDERFWQYWPIRFLWPALSVFAFHKYARRRTVRLLVVVSLLGAIGTVWNADSGLPIEIALAAFIVGKFVLLLVTRRGTSARERRDLVLAFVLHIAIFILVVAAAAVYLIVKSGRSPHWAWLFEYQKLFYGIGFMMLPMPTKPSPWMSVLAMYLLAMMVAVSAWARSPRSRSGDLIFYLSFLGMGLFVYYQGRSHILNLITVCWPAMVLAAILSDRVVRACRAGILPRIQLCLPSVTMTLLLFCSIPLIHNTPDLWKESVINFKTRGQPSDPLVADELSFIRSHSTRGEQCLILAKRQGLYYAATGLVSPVSGPGYVELITSVDRDSLFRQMSTLEAPCVFIGIGPASAVQLDTDPMSILKQYAVKAKSAQGSMLFLQPRLALLPKPY